MKPGEHADETVLVDRVVLASGGVFEVPPTPAQVDAVVGSRLHVVVRDGQALHEERRYSGVAAEAALRARVVNEIVGDGVLGTNTLHASSVLGVGPGVAEVHVLRMTDGDAAAGDVANVVPDDGGVDDVVDERNPFAPAMLHGVADEVDGIGVVHQDHRR